MFKIKKKTLIDSKNLLKNSKSLRITKLPFNPFLEFLSKYFFNSKDKKLTLLLLKYTEKSGSSLREGIENKIKESKKKKNFVLEYILSKVLFYMDIKGYKIVDAMFAAKFITQKEKSILLKSRNFSEGIEQITYMNSRGSKLVLYHLFLFAPSYIVLVVLLATQGIVKDVLTKMVEPIAKAGGTPPPLPQYMQDPHTYLVINIGAFTILFLVLIFYYYLKNFDLPNYFKIFVLNEQENILSVLESINSLIKGGINLTDSVKILLDDEKSVVKKQIYSDIYHNNIKGNISLNKIFDFYNVNYNTISLIQMGEKTNNIEDALQNAKDALEETYNINMLIYKKISFIGGQLLMFGILIIPMINILLYTSVQQLNFKI